LAGEPLGKRLEPASVSLDAMEAKQRGAGGTVRREEQAARTTMIYTNLRPILRMHLLSKIVIDSGGCVLFGFGGSAGTKHGAEESYPEWAEQSAHGFMGYHR
jgi:hypothetical protein